MPKHYYKVTKQELLTIHEQMEPFYKNAFNNSFSIWRRHSCQFRLFKAFLEARIKDSSPLAFNHEKLREELLPASKENIFIIHGKSEAKMAFLFKDIMERKYHMGCTLSGDLWEGRDEAIPALRANLGLKEGESRDFAGILEYHLQRITEELIQNSRDFVFVLPVKVTPDAPVLAERLIRNSPWLPGHMAMIYAKAKRKEPVVVASPDIKFLKAYELRPLIACLREKQLEGK